MLKDRENTNRSLRAERKDIDHLILELADIDVTADEAITRARARADRTLAVTRAHADQLLDGVDPSTAQALTLERSIEDRATKTQRRVEDAVLDVSRAEKTDRVTVERDATNDGLSQERAHADELLRSRDKALGVVAHDLRNMLMTILGMAEFIEEDADPSGGAHSTLSHARYIRQAGVRMGRLLGDLSDMASIEAGKLSLARDLGDAGAIVREAVEMFQRGAVARGVALAVEIEPSLPSVLVDSARIYQVITNLLSNAIKFTPKDGKVAVRVTGDATEICVAVTDTGIGIPGEQLEAVFDRRVQVLANDRQGVGLGLYISRSIVHRHGGRIWAVSIPGGGSTFFFTLPVTPANQQ